MVILYFKIIYMKYYFLLMTWLFVSFSFAQTIEHDLNSIVEAEAKSASIEFTIIA